MNADDEVARAARAKRLHEQIEKLKTPPDQEADPAAKKSDPQQKPLSIREKIEQRMRELDEKEEK